MRRGSQPVRPERAAGPLSMRGRVGTLRGVGVRAIRYGARPGGGCTPQVTAVLARAVDILQTGVVVERVLSEDFGAYRSHAWHRTCDRLGSTPKKTRPHGTAARDGSSVMSGGGGNHRRRLYGVVVKSASELG